MIIDDFLKQQMQPMPFIKVKIEKSCLCYNLSIK
jgi:hypothetical protein